MADTKKAPATCAITTLQFEADDTKPQEVLRKIAEELPMSKKKFSSGSFGYSATGKVTVSIDGVPVKLQVTCNATVVNSKLAD